MTSHVYRFVKSFASWAFATIVVCAGIAAFYYYYRGNEELRTRVELELSKAYPNHSVAVGSARLLQGEGVQLREISIAQPNSGRSSRAELVYIDEATLDCTPTLDQLMRGQIDIERVHVRGMSLYPTRSRDGTWNMAQLIPAIPSKSPPTIEIEDSRVEISDRTNDQPDVVVLRDLQATITPPHLSAKQNDQFAIWVRFANDHVREVDIHADLRPETGEWRIEDGRANGLTADARLFRRLMPQLQSVNELPQSRSLIQGCQGELDLAFAAQRSPQGQLPRFRVNARLANGRFDAPRFLANPITDITAESIEVLHDANTIGWQIKNVNGAYGRTPVHLDFVHANSLSPDTDLQIVGNVKELMLTRGLIGLLSPKLQDLWLKYELLGRMDVDQFSLMRRQGLWSADGDVTCKDASINCTYFPYPVQQVEGKMSYRYRKSLDINLIAATNASANPTHVHIGAKIANPGANYSGEIAVSSHGWMRLDEQLRDAVGPVKQVLGDLAARGEVSFKAVLNREPGKVLQKDIRVDVRNAGAKYVSFPYPLEISQGRIHVTDKLWTFRDFVGRNDSCIVHGTGDWYPESVVTPDGRSGGELRAEFVATDIPCDAELREALPGGPKQVWQSLRPRGHVDYAKVDLVHRHGMQDPEINVLVKQLQSAHDADHRGLEIQPTWFPLRMSRVTGQVKYNADGTFVLNDMRARHGPEKRTVTLQSSGRGIFRGDGTWEVALDRIHADAFETSPELTAALPVSLSASMRSLRFASKLSFNGQMRFAGSSEPGSFVDADWQALIGVDNGKLMLGGNSVDNIFGQVSVTGRQRPAATINWGRASVASLMCKGIQVTNIETPFQMDDQQLVYGSAAFQDPKSKGSRSPHLTARMFGGEAVADGTVAFSDKYPFQVRCSLRNFNVTDVARDFSMPANMSGRGDAGLELSGNSEGTHTWRGKGNVRLRDANLAKLPALISLVNNLKRHTRPDVFTSSDIAFNIDGAYVNLEQFDLHGESLSMKGRGWIGMDRRLELAFYSILGGEQNWFKAALPFGKMMSRGTWQILVTGTLDKMRWAGQALPGFNELLLEQAEQTTPRRR